MKDYTLNFIYDTFIITTTVSAFTKEQAETLAIDELKYELGSGALLYNAVQLAE